MLGNIPRTVTQHNSKFSRYLYCKDDRNFDRLYFNFKEMRMYLELTSLIAFERNVRDLLLGDKNMTCTYHIRTIVYLKMPKGVYVWCE